MRLTTVHVTEFQSVRNSNPFSIGDITCLVGKNEAGKTALLQALYRLNPIIEADGKFDVVDDYPRADVEDYQFEIEAGKRQPATVIRATFELEEKELNVGKEKFGSGALTHKTITLEKGYKNERSVDCRGDYKKALTHVIKNSSIPQPTIDALLTNVTPDHIETTLASVEQTADVKAVRGLVADIGKVPTFGNYIYNKMLAPFLPKFLYFDEYYQMKGRDNIEALRQGWSRRNSRSMITRSSA